MMHLLGMLSAHKVPGQRTLPMPPPTCQRCERSTYLPGSGAANEPLVWAPELRSSRQHPDQHATIDGQLSSAEIADFAIWANYSYLMM